MVYDIEKLKELTREELLKLAKLIVDNMTDEEIRQLCTDFIN